MSRLEEIKTQLDRFMTPPSKPCLFRDDAEYLIDQAQKAEELQAKVDELEKDNGRSDRFATRTFKAYKALKNENQHYKQALENLSFYFGTIEIRPDLVNDINQALKGVEG